MWLCGACTACTERAERATTDRTPEQDERTSNMLPMSVTLDVSKLSGWLNARAYCAERVASRAHGTGRAARAGRREAARERGVQGRGCNCRSVQGGERDSVQIRAGEQANAGRTAKIGGREQDERT